MEVEIVVVYVVVVDEVVEGMQLGYVCGGGGCQLVLCVQLIVCVCLVQCDVFYECCSQ